MVWEGEAKLTKSALPAIYDSFDGIILGCQLHNCCWTNKLLFSCQGNVSQFLEDFCLCKVAPGSFHCNKT